MTHSVATVAHPAAKSIGSSRVAPNRIRAGWVAAVTVHSAAIAIPTLRLLNFEMKGLVAMAAAFILSAYPP
jgi:hypothetical protein